MFNKNKDEGTKKPMTDEERLALAQKLDNELDEFIDGLEKKRYSEGWKEETWEEEMAKHPFFMKCVPESGEMSPLAEGLAKLKYDPSENTPDELANNYKEDGNFNFKHKNYRLAILSYTEGIKAKPNNPDILASLYNNRSAAHLLLHNYRSALADAEYALKYQKNHKKARIRAAKSAFNIKSYNKCIEHCENLINSEVTDLEIRDLLKEARKQLQIQLRDERKRNKTQVKSDNYKKLIYDAIKSRGVRLFTIEDELDFELDKLVPTYPGASDAVVKLENEILIWPIMILYPEFGMSDLIKDCPENVPLCNQIDQIFPPPWDEYSRYSIGNVNVYFIGSDRKAHLVNLNSNLGDILKCSGFIVRSGTPEFYVVIPSSQAEINLLK